MDLQRSLDPGMANDDGLKDQIVVVYRFTKHAKHPWFQIVVTLMNQMYAVHVGEITP